MVTVRYYNSICWTNQPDNNFEEDWDEKVTVVVALRKLSTRDLTLPVVFQYGDLLRGTFHQAKKKIKNEEGELVIIQNPITEEWKGRSPYTTWPGSN